MATHVPLWIADQVRNDMCGLASSDGRFRKGLKGQNFPCSATKRSGMVDEQCGRDNLSICVMGIGGSKPFSALLTEYIPNLHFIEAGQNFPRYSYEEIGVGE